MEKGIQIAGLTGGGGDGVGLKILDYFNSFAELTAAVPNPEPGDAYGVGTAFPYNIYVYGKTSGWKDNGVIKGEPGPAGEPGEAGPAGPNEISTSTATDINGMLKGNGSTVQAAVVGVDYAPAYTFGTADLAAGSSPLANGTLYFVYE